MDARLLFSAHTPFYARDTQITFSMLETCEESLFSGLTAISAMFAEDRFPAAHRYFCSRNNTGCFAHLLWLDSSSDPKPPQDVLNSKGAAFPSLSAANTSQKSQLLAVGVTNAALQKNTIRQDFALSLYQSRALPWTAHRDCDWPPQQRLPPGTRVLAPRFPC